MTEMPIEQAAHAAAGTGPQHARGEQPRRQTSPLAALRDVHAQLSGNPLITAITAHPGMGERLSDREIDAVLRVVSAIETPRIEAEQARGGQ